MFACRIHYLKITHIVFFSLSAVLHIFHWIYAILVYSQTFSGELVQDFNIITWLNYCLLIPSHLFTQRWPDKCGPSNIPIKFGPTVVAYNVAHQMWPIRCGPSDVAHQMWPADDGGTINSPGPRFPRRQLVRIQSGSTRPEVMSARWCDHQDGSSWNIIQGDQRSRLVHYFVSKSYRIIQLSHLTLDNLNLITWQEKTLPLDGQLDEPAQVGATLTRLADQLARPRADETS